MAIVVTKVASYPDTRESVYDITLDASYASGGYAVTNAQFGCLTAPDAVEASFSTGEGFNPTWVVSTGKLKIYKNAAGAGAFTECINTDLTASMKVRCQVTGTPIL